MKATPPTPATPSTALPGDTTLTGAPAGESPGAGGDPARLLAVVERAVTARLSAALAEVDCTLEEWRVLELLADGRGHPMTEIAEYALLPPPTLTKLVDRMVAANRVYRRVDDADRRRVLVLLAERGHSAHRRAAEAADHTWRTVTAALGPTDTALLTSLLTRATTHLT